MDLPRGSSFGQVHPSPLKPLNYRSYRHPYDSRLKPSFYAGTIPAPVKPDSVASNQENDSAAFESIKSLNNTFKALLYQRNEFYPVLKEKARNRICRYLNANKLNAFRQDFTTFSQSYRQVITGVNLIGIKPGLHRGTPNDSLIVIGAHYDTVGSTKGVDDNLSGVVALIELAKSVTNVKLDHTLIFVAFDYEERVSEQQITQHQNEVGSAMFCFQSKHLGEVF